VDIKGRVERGEMRDEFRLFRKDIGAEVDVRAIMPEGKWSDLHIDLSKLEANCRFREVLWKVCEGGLDPSMGVPMECDIPAYFGEAKSLVLGSELARLFRISRQCVLRRSPVRLSRRRHGEHQLNFRCI
jgi:hypothetical protein